MYQMGLVIERARLIYWVKTNVPVPMASIRSHRDAAAPKDRWWEVVFKDGSVKGFIMNGRIAVANGLGDVLLEGSSGALLTEAGEHLRWE